MPYATDTDLTDRYAAATSATLARRTLALADAMAEIDDRVYDGTTVEAHVLLAMHKLAERGFLGTVATGGGGATGFVTSRKAGAIATTYTLGTGAAANGPHSSTTWGRSFDAMLPAATPLTDCPEPGSWP